MKVTVALTMTLNTPEGNPVNEEQAKAAAADAEAAIQSRLMGEGFLPDDVEVDAYAIVSTVDAEG